MTALFPQICQSDVQTYLTCDFMIWLIPSKIECWMISSNLMHAMCMKRVTGKGKKKKNLLASWVGQNIFLP